MRQSTDNPAGMRMHPKRLIVVTLSRFLARHFWEVFMGSVTHTLGTFLLVTGISFCQTTPAMPGNATEPAAASPEAATSDAQAGPAADPNAITIPAGTRIPLGLKQAISTKNAREGDPV